VRSQYNTKPITMSYFGLRGKSLSITLSMVAATAFALQGYDQAVMNGLLTLDTFTAEFPRMKNSNIEGTHLLPFLNMLFVSKR
jgi:hypothetical protein